MLVFDLTSEQATPLLLLLLLLSSDRDKSLLLMLELMLVGLLAPFSCCKSWCLAIVADMLDRAADFLALVISLSLLS